MALGSSARVARTAAWARRVARGRGVRGVCTAATVVLIVAWALLLRPQMLGGPAGYVLVSGTSMLPGLHTGDLVIVRRHPSYRRGDVVAFRVPAGQPAAGAMVIHRIVGGSPRTGFVTRGDNRATSDLWRPTPADIHGRRWVALPGAGRLVGILREPLLLATLAACFAFFSLGTPPRRR
jgi:signal peptidase I